MKRNPVATTTDPTIDALGFDDALAELQRTVAELEASGQPLEAAIALYERGVALQARCAKLLGDAELRVQHRVMLYVSCRSCRPSKAPPTCVVSTRSSWPSWPSRSATPSCGPWRAR